MIRRRVYFAAGCAVTVHTAAFFALDRYRQLMADVGDLFTHATDVADLPKLLLIGFVIFAVIAAIAAVLLEAWVWRLRDDAPPKDRRELE